MAEWIDDYEVPTEEPESRNFDPIPVPEVVAQIIESDLKNTSTGSGRMLTLTWEVTEGPFERRQFWQSINYRNNSAKAQEIGQKQLDEVTYSTGITKLTNTEDLHFIPCLLRLRIKPAEGQYPAKNEVVSVKRLGAAAAPATPAQRQPATRPATAQPAQRTTGAAAGNRPWPTQR